MRGAPLILLLLSLAGIFRPALAVAADQKTVAGLELGTLSVGKSVYLDVRVRSQDGRSLFFSHRQGLGSVRLRDLPPDLQTRLGYDPATAPPDTPPSALSPQNPRPTAPASRPTVRTTSFLDSLFLAYAEEPELRPAQSLQAEFFRLGLYAKNQGRRPSCSIFAVVSALEYQNARLSGSVETLSEEYLVWATRRSLGITGPAAPLETDGDTGEPLEDSGYTLPSVISALQTYGIPLYEDMRNQPGSSAGSVSEPSAETIARARSRRLVFIAPLPGREPAQLVRHLVHALNEGFPVPSALRWPYERTIRGGVLAGQPPAPNAFHAVTFVGYECPTGKLEDAVFIFKNSYGPRWGQGGYGRATAAYLSQYLLEAYVLDVREPSNGRR